MRVGHVTPAEHRGFFYRWRWPLVLAAVTVTAIVFAGLGGLRPQVVVYPTTDFARLPTNAATSATPVAPISCVSVRRVNGSPKLVGEACGSPASTFRVIGRVGNVSQCVHDADLTYSWSSGPKSGAVCLDYDWAAGQCLQITSNAVSKVDCTKRGAVQPEMAIIGAVDVTYCREGGIAHAIRRFTVCTLAGNKNCKGRAHGI
jgi:hypothetical protein